MTIYCDESGGLPAGALCFAAVSIPLANADALLQRIKAVTGLRGELKGSRIGLTERALFFEYLERYDGSAWVSVARREVIAPPGSELPEDLGLYTRLLRNTLMQWQDDALTGKAPVDVVIDDGRYDAVHMAEVKRALQHDFNQRYNFGLADSRRSAGVQIADVIANSIFNIAVRSDRSDRIRTIIKPFLDNQRIRVAEIDTP